jgi:predicted 3-demethylubiquinone-9 3-methyltransferase (glyoxalase superfamily)
MKKIRPNLWFNFNGEEAMAFYKSVFPDFEELGIKRTPVDTPGPKAGDVVIVNFRIFDQEFVGINGGPDFSFNESVSFEISCADQAEVDYYWDKLTADGGEESFCGWLKDKFGLSWQVVPTRLYELMDDPDEGRAKRSMEAMLKQRKIVIADLEAAANGG